MRHKYLKYPCDSCKKKFHETIFYKGNRYCKSCYPRALTPMPNIQVKTMKCFGCGEEKYVPLNSVLNICPCCLGEMKEIGL